MQQIVRNDRHHDIQLEVAPLTRQGDGEIVSDDLGRYLQNRFRDDGVHLARHDGGSRLQGGNPNFTQTAAGTGCKPSDIICDFCQADCRGLQSATYFDRCILGALGLEMMDGFEKIDFQVFRQQADHATRKLRVRIQAVADGRLTVVLKSNVVAIDEREVRLEQEGRTLQLPNDAVIVSAGGVLPTPFLQKIGIKVETKYGTA